MSWFGPSSVFPRWCRIEGQARPDLPSPHRLEADLSVVWEASASQRLPYVDHLEMSGLAVSVLVSYGVDRRGRLRLSQHLVFPALRLKKDDTRGNLRHTFGRAVDFGHEQVEWIRIRGSLEIRTRTAQGLTVTRTIVPSPRHAASVETIRLENLTSGPLTVRLPSLNRRVRTPASRGKDGAVYELTVEARPASGTWTLAPGDLRTLTVTCRGTPVGRPETFDAEAQGLERGALVDGWWSNLRLESPSPVLDAAFAHAKLRAAESIFQTKGGLMHCPGGGEFYAALWTNDQCEYANPYFPLTGDERGIAQALNGYRLFQSHLDPEGKTPLVSSIVAQGEGVWNGAGDRGDGAMFAYGAGRFCLSLGDRTSAEELWPGIELALAYSLGKTTAQGVVASDSDELENRFPSGKANLSTSCLVYDACLSAAWLAEALGKPTDTAARYRKSAEALRVAIGRHFGAVVEGFETYRYYEGNRTLRAWICAPLAMGIFDRAEGTVQALFSDRLWTANGLRTEAGKRTFWDRSTLYALRGIFASGRPDRALEALEAYSRERLLGRHVPYPVEAWPEGNQRHLAAEGALYARVFLEGLLGLRPVGFGRYECLPQLPSTWPRLALRRMGGLDQDLEVTQDGSRVRLTVVLDGQTVYSQTSPRGTLHRIPLTTRFTHPQGETR